MSITGNLRTLEFAELLQWLAQGQKTGALVIQNGQIEKRIYFTDGKIISSESNNPEEHLGSFMVREGLIDEATLARAVKLQESTQILLGKVLVTLGTITEEELHQILCKKTEESLYELFNWTEGEFRFLPDDLPRLPMVPLEIDVTNVVLEGAKRFDEARRDAKQGKGDHSSEIDEVLSSEIFQGIEVSDSGSAPVVPDSGEHEALAVPEPEVETVREPPSAQTRGYYSGKTTTQTRTPLLAAAATLVAIVIGVVAYLVMRPDPAVGVADRASVDSAPPIELPESVNDSELYRGLEPPSEGNDVVPVEAEPEPPPAEGVPPSQDAKMQARYEAELAALKQQLRQAQVAAAERDDAMDRVAELEEQVARAAQQGETQPSSLGIGQMALAQMPEVDDEPSLSAGGDEAPPLGSPIPATGPDQEEGNDFAADMVESTSGHMIAEAESGPAEQIADLTPPVQLPADQITAPQMLTPPKPRYPATARRMRKQAVVTLRLLIDGEGKVIDVEQVGAKAGMGFDSAALNAAMKTEWRPGTRNGEPAEMWTDMRIAFQP